MIEEGLQIITIMTIGMVAIITAVGITMKLLVMLFDWIDNNI